MAKGQKRSTRETKKPKQDKAVAKPANPLGGQSKFVTSTNAPRGKDKP